MKCSLTCLGLSSGLCTRSDQFRPQGHATVAVCENGATEAQSGGAAFKRTCSREVTDWDLNPRSVNQACAFNRYALLTLV